MVAMMIVSIGLLALAGAAAMLTRLTGGGAMQTRAAMAASSRMELLRAVPCGSLTSGQDTARNVVSRWTVQPVTLIGRRRGVSVQLAVQYPTPQGNRTQRFRTVLPC